MQFGGYHIYDQHAPHFLTLTVTDWIDAFSRPTYKQLAIDSLKFYQDSRGLIIYGYVLMSNHLHMIAQTPDNKLSDFIRDYKRWISRQMRILIEEENESRLEWMKNRFEWRGRINAQNIDFQFWEVGNHPKVILTPDFAWQKLEYIHMNPVRAQIVAEPEHYLYSSAIDYAGGRGLLPIEFLDIQMK